MTSPNQPPPELEQFLQHAAELYALEKLASKMAVGPLRKQVQGVWRSAAALWVRMFGGLDNPAIPERHGEYLSAVKRQIAAINPDVAGPLAEYVDKALAMGVRHAAAEVGVHVTTPPGPVKQEPATPAEGISTPPRPARIEQIDWPTVDQPGPAPRRPGHGTRRDWPTVDLDPAMSDTTSTALDTLDRDVKEQLLHAEHAVEQVAGDLYKDVTDALAETQKAVVAADRATTVVVNEAANTGSDQLAAKLGAARLWVAERNACLHCLALSGEVAPPGGHFDGSLTFGKKPLPVWPPGSELESPPRHPNCRCRCTPWLGSAPGYTGPDLPAALKREAQRSILVGWRTETESERARLDAAARLLRRGTTLPKSVQARARTAVKRGSFGEFPRRQKGTPP